MKSGSRDLPVEAERPREAEGRQQWLKATVEPPKKREVVAESPTGKYQLKTGQVKRDAARE